MNLNGSVAIVTGASGGFGRELAHTLAGRGSRLVLTARRVDRLDELAATLRAAGTDVVTLPGRVSSPATASAFAEVAMERFGGIDVLVNAARYEVWQATIGSCLTGPYLMSRAVKPTMLAKGSGQIVQISSIAAKGAEANRTAYCAAKWGLHGFSLSLQEELRETGVRVQLVCPGSVATDWWDVTGDPQPPEVLDRMLTPGDVARAVLWLLDQPDHVHVGELVVGHGRSQWAG
jgi:3-oxoacyl-[acyl-carrier protein] reductase